MYCHNLKCYQKAAACYLHYTRVPPAAEEKKNADETKEVLSSEPETCFAANSLGIIEEDEIASVEKVGQVPSLLHACVDAFSSMPVEQAKELLKTHLSSLPLDVRGLLVDWLFACGNMTPELYGMFVGCGDITDFTYRGIRYEGVLRSLFDGCASHLCRLNLYLARSLSVKDVTSIPRIAPNLTYLRLDHCPSVTRESFSALLWEPGLCVLSTLSLAGCKNLSLLDSSSSPSSPPSSSSSLPSTVSLLSSQISFSVSSTATTATATTATSAVSFHIPLTSSISSTESLSSASACPLSSSSPESIAYPSSQQDEKEISYLEVPDAPPPPDLSFASSSSSLSSRPSARSSSSSFASSSSSSLSFPSHSLSLQTLDISGCVALVSPSSQPLLFSSVLQKCVCLTSLDLSACAIRDLDDSFACLSSLVILSLKGNSLRGVPACLAALSRLTDLNLSGNQIVSLPSALPLNLMTLNLRNNKLTGLPPSISALTSLRLLDLSFNSLSALPLQLTSLVNLTTLDLNYNRLPNNENMQEIIKGLPSLIVLRSSFNAS